jgi:hypothetical protein
MSPTRLLLIGSPGFKDEHIYQLKEDGEADFNFLTCHRAYQYVFSSWEPIRLVRQILDVGERFEAEMNAVLDPVIQRAYRGIGRNAPCVCGSGVKFKKCCGK